MDCPLYVHCFDGQLQWKVVELVDPVLQHPDPENRKWVEAKMLHVSMKGLKMQPHPGQKTLETFVKEETVHD